MSEQEKLDARLALAVALVLLFVGIVIGRISA
jgi:hypothetical protein